MVGLNMRGLFLCVVIFISLVPSIALGDLDVSIFPGTVRQGDVIRVKVTGDPPLFPTGSIGDTPLLFYRVADGAAYAIAFIGLEQKPGTYEIIVRLNGSMKKIDLRVRAVKAEKIHLTLPENKVSLSPEDEARADREIARMRAFWPNISEKMWYGRFIKPVDQDVSTEFGLLRIINNHKKSVHKGVDFRGREGIPVKSMNAGKVVLTENEFFGGNTVMLDHGDGIFSIYMHLQKIVVKAGSFVEKGETVGLMGSTGRATGPHLHLSLKYRGLTINPLSLINSPLL